MTLRPEEIEEEGGAEDGRYCYSNKDVVGSDPNVVIVVYCRKIVQVFDKGLLVDVVYRRLQVSSLDQRHRSVNSHAPVRAAVPTDSEQMQSVMAIW